MAVKLINKSLKLLGQPIVKKEIQKMIDSYYNSLVDKNDATSAWVSIYEVMALIAANKGANGIRIYYGRHNGEIVNGVDYKNYHGLILVTTMDSVNPSNPRMEDSKNLLIDNVSSVSYTGNGDDNIPTKPPRGAANKPKL